jgi:hypothetical protein
MGMMNKDEVQAGVESVFDGFGIKRSEYRRRLQSETDCAPSPFLAEIPSHLIEENAPEETEEDEAKAAADFFAQLKRRFRVDASVDKPFKAG